MYIVHFMKYEDDILTDAWVSEDYFETDCDAERWLLEPRAEDSRFIPNGIFEYHYKNENDGVRLEAEIRHVTIFQNYNR